MWKYTRITEEMRFEYSSVDSNPSPLMLFLMPDAFTRSSAVFHGSSSMSRAGTTMGMGHPPQRCTSLAKKMVGKCSSVSSRANATCARGPALRFSAVTSVSACRMMVLETDESSAM